MRRASVATALLSASVVVVVVATGCPKPPPPISTRDAGQGGGEGEGATEGEGAVGEGEGVAGEGEGEGINDNAGTPCDVPTQAPCIGGTVCFQEFLDGDNGTCRRPCAVVNPDGTAGPDQPELCGVGESCQQIIVLDITTNQLAGFQPLCLPQVTGRDEECTSTFDTEACTDGRICDLLDVVFPCPPHSTHDPLEPGACFCDEGFILDDLTFTDCVQSPGALGGDLIFADGTFTGNNARIVSRCKDGCPLGKPNAEADCENAGDVCGEGPFSFLIDEFQETATGGHVTCNEDSCLTGGACPCQTPNGFRCTATNEGDRCVRLLGHCGTPEHNETLAEAQTGQNAGAVCNDFEEHLMCDDRPYRGDVAAAKEACFRRSTFDHDGICVAVCDQVPLDYDNQGGLEVGGQQGPYFLGEQAISGECAAGEVCSHALGEALGGIGVKGVVPTAFCDATVCDSVEDTCDTCPDPTSERCHFPSCPPASTQDVNGVCHCLPGSKASADLRTCDALANAPGGEVVHKRGLCAFIPGLCAVDGGEGEGEGAEGEGAEGEGAEGEGAEGEGAEGEGAEGEGAEGEGAEGEGAEGEGAEGEGAGEGEGEGTADAGPADAGPDDAGPADAGPDAGQ